MLPRTAFVLAWFAILVWVQPTAAFEAFRMKESDPADGSAAGAPCALTPNLTGDCANLRYYNVCSGYIWIYSLGQLDEGWGVRFDDACVTAGNSIDRAITYWRNVIPNYSQTVDVHVDVDVENDGCPDYVLASDLDLDPGLRWNCSDFGPLCIPGDAQAIIVRALMNGGAAPSGPITDGPFNQECEPLGSPHSYYYGIGGSGCMPWPERNGRQDNLLYWLIVDSGCLTSTEPTSWGKLKSLYQ